MAADNKSEQVYAQLRESILDGTLRPGESLSVISIGERFSASRTPVRRALVQLEAEGLVSLVDRQGVRVAPISIQGVRDLFELRMLLEAAAVRMVADTIDSVPAARQAFTEILDGLDPLADQAPSDQRRDRFYELAEAFDQAVIAHTRNEHLARSIAELRPHSARLRIIAHSRPQRLDTSLAEHRTMCRAILAGEGDAAANACTGHLAETQRTILDAVINPVGSGVPVQLITA
ncbi:GntR family transcriptional regulator [Rhodococcus sp. NPDC057014]|uniref:GntR family transcriptional regulator n=1 Tax=Rhodococcus sp. NPDC057014 TaxID=3346000 RepID=UPI00363D1D5C